MTSYYHFSLGLNTVFLAFLSYALVRSRCLCMYTSLIHNTGTDVTLVAASRTVGIALEAAIQLQEEHGINAEVINLRTLRPLDREAIAQSVAKTHYLVTVEGGWPQFGVGSEVSASVVEGNAVTVIKVSVFTVFLLKLSCYSSMEENSHQFVAWGH